MDTNFDDATARYEAARQRELARLVVHFHRALRAQLKPLCHAVGVAAQTVRNNGNTIRLNGLDIRPSVVCGRVTFDLEEVAAALARGAVQAPPPARTVTGAPGGGGAEAQADGVDLRLGEKHPDRETRHHREGAPAIVSAERKVLPPPKR